MSGNSLMTIGQPNRFARQTTQIARPNRPSPRVLEWLMQLVAELDSALAVRPAQPVQVKQVESRQIDVKPPAKAPEEKVDRKKMRNMFD